MRKMYKVILAGVTAFLAACSNDASVDSGISGATTEPSTSPKAELTEEQKAILANSLYTLVDSTKVDSLKAIFGSDVTNIDYRYFGTFPFSIKNDQVFSYPSKDGRKVCDVVTYKQENKRDQKGVLRAMSYNEVDHKCKWEGTVREEKECHADDYMSTHGHETIVNTKIIDVDGIPVVMKTIADSHFRQFWGYGVSCGEYLKEFKQSCNASNGLFVDMGDGCSMNNLKLACASFIPEGKTSDEVLKSYTEGYKIQCLEDSIKYAPYDDENNVYQDPALDSLYRDSVDRVTNLIEEWYQAQKRSTAAYRWQFTIIDSTVVFDGDNLDYYEEREDPELIGVLGWAYNTLPNTKIADAYRKEGVYVLPDSLVIEFFPNLATYPAGLEGLKWYPPEIFYLVVIKDIGTKGHLITGFDANGIYVTDIVKSGNCPEDTTVHYSMILLADSPDWNVLDRSIVKTTYVSDNWNCDKPETLEKIDPYGEWTYSNVHDYYWYVELFGKD